ncbi:hypothetical protein [Streptomyces sp. KN37]|uniref:hypothetical protein n=1 Tax=Streptomyces sp. KN37 TaxID=3090667 RepID=UPI002A761490|nr:hypothetical protein [Streptomyces sp. KN37]WPO70242.1 hypothetical protein R9806_06165 [Streptomyces sp. KN37]
MGYALRRWLADRLPADLSSGERLVALEIADQANEKTRLAYGSNLLDIIVHRTGLANQKQVGKVLGKLAASGLELRVPVRDKNGEIICNKAGRPLYAFEGRKLTFRIPEEKEFPAREVPRWGEHSAERSPQRGSTGAERSPARGQEVPLQGDLVSSPLLKPPPLKASTPSAPADGVAGRQQQHEDRLAAAAAFLETLPEPWTIGPVSARATAPDLVRMIDKQGWDLDADLVAKLTERPGGITSYPPILRIRIKDLPRRIRPAPRTRSAPLSPWCGECADGAKAAEREGRLRLVYDAGGHARPCPKCHPDMTSNAA